MNPLVSTFSISALCCAASFAFAADTERGVSVYDSNPHCLERTTHPEDPACTLWQRGVPRQTFPPRNTIILPSQPAIPSGAQTPQANPNPAGTAQQPNPNPPSAAQDGNRNQPGAATQANRGTAAARTGG